MNQIRRATRRAVPCLGLFALLACADSTAPGKGIAGSWVRENDIPGSGEVLTLTTAGSTVSGSGSWSGEACCSGTIAVTGTTRGAAVSLDLVYTATAGAIVPQRRVHFEGRLTMDRLVGTSAADGASSPTTYERTQPIAF